MKIHNVFIAALGEEIQYYTALVRSLDSSLGSMLEKMVAVNIASLKLHGLQTCGRPFATSASRLYRGLVGTL